MYKEILVGIDGSPQSLRAAEHAGNLARVMSADLCIVVAFEPLPMDLGESMLQSLIASRMLESEKLLSLALESSGTINGTIFKEILEGPPAEAILAVADTHKTDLIVMGTRGLGRIASLVLGSQSMKVVSEAQCPVLLVR